jgi:response regulator NasT
VGTGKQLVELCRASPPDLVMTDIKMPDMDGIQAAEAINREKEVPVILVSAYHDAEVLQRAGTDHSMSYLIKPVSQADAEAAVALAMDRFERYQAVRTEAAALRQALEDRKLVERAKGSVRKRLGVGEEEAYRRLKRLASTHNRKPAEVARVVLAGEGVFRQMEGG